MVVIDASVLVNYFSGRIDVKTEWLDQQNDLGQVGITDLILTEVLQGIRDEDSFTETLNALGQFTVFDTGNRNLAINAARNYRALRKLGLTIRSTIDCLTATFCIEGGHELLHSDRDFDAFEQHLGLRVLHPQP